MDEPTPVIQTQDEITKPVESAPIAPISEEPPKPVEIVKKGRRYFVPVKPEKKRIELEGEYEGEWLEWTQPSITLLDRASSAVHRAEREDKSNDVDLFLLRNALVAEMITAWSLCYPPEIDAETGAEKAPKPVPITMETINSVPPEIVLGIKEPREAALSFLANLS